MSQSEDLEKQAIEELLRESESGLILSQSVGPSAAYVKPSSKVNKRFLKSVLQCAVRGMRGLKG
ncbi:Hypothetical protein FKW44_016505 [Caligus rogercresseyi]|uniref:Uncharacterized protein n=1 Tax=Caligus rogercresseyi TaxID=217165 RepID=A0A7T8K0H9_CALRO|nr:Hypothetical protein FKW44_016505 [Caligus rogercresseyi]